MSSLISQARTRIPRFAEEAVERARLRVVPPRRLPVRRAPFVALVVLLLGGGVAGLLAFNTSMQQQAFTLTALQREATAAEARKQSLEMELEALRDPQQLAARAKALGMVPPPTAAFVDLRTGKVVGDPLAATVDGGMRINPLPAKKPRVLAPKAEVHKVVGKPWAVIRAERKAQRLRAERLRVQRERAAAASADRRTAEGRKKAQPQRQERQR